jgi:hypothetical protein
MIHRPVRAAQPFGQYFGAQGGQAIVQAAAGFVGGDRRASLQHHRTGIQAGFHLHQIDAAFRIAGKDGALDRRGAAPARQQAGVHVPAAQARNGQHLARQDQAVGHHHQQVGLIAPASARLGDFSDSGCSTAMPAASAACLTGLG